MKIITEIGLSQRVVLHYLICSGPGRSAGELFQALFGKPARMDHARIQEDLNRLVQAGLVERRGGGGPTDPYRYYPRIADRRQAVA